MLQLLFLASSLTVLGTTIRSQNFKYKSSTDTGSLAYWYWYCWAHLPSFQSIQIETPLIYTDLVGGGGDGGEREREDG